MWMKSNQHRFSVNFAGNLVEAINDDLVPDMHPIERSGGNHSISDSACRLGRVVKYLHYFNFLSIAVSGFTPIILHEMPVFQAR
jgi:hypothetical protein